MKRIFILVAVLLIAIPVLANNDNSTKLDSLLNMQRKINNAVSELRAEQKNNPLAYKRFGIELNPFYLLIKDNTIISASFSFFMPEKGIEIALPVYFVNDYDTDDIDVFSIDSHLRYFLGNTMNGFYISVHARYAHVDGLAEVNNFLGIGPVKKVDLNENRFGIGFGIGYRIFSYRSFFWGTSLSVGRYLGKEIEEFEGNTVFHNFNYLNEYYFDIELLKFGFSF